MTIKLKTVSNNYNSNEICLKRSILLGLGLDVHWVLPLWKTSVFQRFGLEPAYRGIFSLHFQRLWCWFLEWNCVPMVTIIMFEGIWGDYFSSSRYTQFFYKHLLLPSEHGRAFYIIVARGVLSRSFFGAFLFRITNEPKQPNLSQTWSRSWHWIRYWTNSPESTWNLIKGQVRSKNSFWCVVGN